MAKKEYSTFERQMSAVIGKMLSDLEAMECMRGLHPLEFDKLRKRCISAVWDGYLVGRRKGLMEAEKDESLDTTESGVFGSNVSSQQAEC